MNNKEIIKEFREWYKANCGFESKPRPERIEQFWISKLDQQKEMLKVEKRAIITNE